MGRIATILFAHRLGTALEPECKMYRLAADVLNDTAMVLDCLSPAFPKPARVLLLSFSSVLRSLCGVCAGSAKASLSAHFAKKGNLGELNAVSGNLAHSEKTSLCWLGHCCILVLFLVENEVPRSWCFVFTSSILLRLPFVQMRLTRDSPQVSRNADLHYRRIRAKRQS